MKQKIFGFLGKTMSKMFKKVFEKKVYISNLDQLREDLKKDLEGRWKLKGTFSKFHNINAEHQSTGFLILQWISRKQYSVTYCYSVKKSGEKESIVTAICEGNSIGDLRIGDQSQLNCALNIVSRTSTKEIMSYNSSFPLTLEVVNEDRDDFIRTLKALFETPETLGELFFYRDI